MMDGFVNGALLPLSFKFLITSRLREIKIFYKIVFHVSTRGNRIMLTQPFENRYYQPGK